MFTLSTRDKAILIARALKNLGYNVIAKFAEKESNDAILDGYLLIAQLAASKDPEKLAECEYFGVISNFKSAPELLTYTPKPIPF